jgi:hypothetical protein
MTSARNGRSGGLCMETQGRQIVAAIVNDAVEEALGLLLSADGQREQTRRKAASGE